MYIERLPMACSHPVLMQYLRRHHILLLCTVALGRKIKPDANGEFTIDRVLDTNEFSFLWIGDWGGWPAPVYNTPIQIAVAKSMERTAKLYEPQFVYGIGDNFYFWGVRDVYDVMWTKTFENVYRSDELQGGREKFQISHHVVLITTVRNNLSDTLFVSR